MNKYPINDLFYTIQGEGLQTGTPAVFLRLHGCNVGCPFCDTKETWEFDPMQEVATIEAACAEPYTYTWQTAQTIASHITAHWLRAKWVVVTGGEPALYPLTELVEALHNINLRAAIETSGTANGHVGAGFDWVTVSPKINMPSRLPILPEAMAEADEIKHVVGRSQDIDQLDELLAAFDLKAAICLQPMSQNQRATELAIEIVKQRGWRLSLQTHKFINIP